MTSQQTRYVASMVVFFVAAGIGAAFVVDGRGGEGRTWFIGMGVLAGGMVVSRLVAP